MGVDEVDRTDSTLIDAYMIALEDITNKGGAPKTEDDEITRAFTG